MAIDYSELRQLAEQSAKEAGDLIVDLWVEPRQIKSKGFRDFVTDADLASQELVTSLILSRFSNHGFVTEEEAPHLSASGDVVWIIDPLDGTSNYSRYHPIFCVSVAAATRKNDGSLHIVASVIYDPIHEELFSAGDGLGCTMNGESISVSGTDTLETSIIGLDWSRGQSRRQAILNALEGVAHRVHTIRAIGSAALAMAWVACGRLDVYFNVGVGAWDVAAAAVIIREAGGLVTNYQGRTWSTDHPTCIASNGRLHLDFLKASQLGDWQLSDRI